MFGSAPKITDSASTIAAYVATHRAQIMTASLLYPVAIVLGVWFGAALATAFRRADETSDAPTVVLAGLTYAMSAHPELPPVAAGQYTALAVVGMIAGVAGALPLGASAVAIAHTHVFPMWMAWFAGVAAAVRGLSALTAGISGGVLAPGTTVTLLPSLLAGPVGAGRELAAGPRTPAVRSSAARSAITRDADRPDARPRIVQALRGGDGDDAAAPRGELSLLLSQLQPVATAR